MTRGIAVILVLLFALALLVTPHFTVTSVASTTDQRPHISGDSRLPAGSWRLVFDDHFDGDCVDSTKWITSFPWGSDGANSSELQYYEPDAFQVTSSLARIKAEQRTMDGHTYTSGIITSYGRFAMMYGYAEIRAKMPSGKGYWPAFWLLPVTTDWPPEIDVLEILGHEPTRVYMTNHFSQNGQEESTGGDYLGPDFSQGFHTFGVEWQPGTIIWYVDGVERFRTNQGVESEPMYLLANLAVGGDWPGNPDASTVFPGYMDIDYIRAYQKSADVSYPFHTLLPSIEKLATGTYY